MVDFSYRTSQNFRFEITVIFRVKTGGFFHAGEKLAIPLVDRDGASVSASRFASSRNGNLVQKER